MSIFDTLYQERPVTVINLFDHDVEVLKPEGVVLKIKVNSKAGDSYFDIGSLCFRLRRSRFAGRIKSIDQFTKLTEVVLSSKEAWRIELVAALIEHIRAQVITKTSDTVKGIIKTLLIFFDFCEKYIDFNKRSQTFEGILSIYRDYTDNLRHRNKLSPNNPQSMSKSVAASMQRIVRRFLMYYFNKSEIDIISHAPSISRGNDRDSIVSASDSSKRDDFIKFSSALFYGLADGIISQDYAPIKLTLPIRGEIVSFIYSAPASSDNIVLNEDLTWPSFDKNSNIIDKSWVNADSNRRRIIRLATNQAKAQRSFISPSYSLSKAYVLAQSAFIACFYAATGINASPLVQLKITSDVPKTLRGMRFSGLKARAGNKTVYPEFGSNFLKMFNKFRALRSYVIKYFGDEELWFFRPVGHLKKLDADATLLPLKNFIKKHNLDISILTPTQIRKGVAVDFLRLSHGNVLLTSEKLGNTVNTVASSYTANAPLEQSREFSYFYQKMFQSALERTRTNEVEIGVLNATNNDFEIPAGHCSNTQSHVPYRIDGFSEFAPQPDCSRPETCLFCKHYAIMNDKEDISKLLGLKELIKLVKIHAGTSDKYIKILSPMYYRVNEIIRLIINKHPESEVIITEVQAEIEQGVLHPFWEEHYDFLIELGFKL